MNTFPVPCKQHGCPAHATKHGRCDDHQREEYHREQYRRYDERRPKTKDRGYGGRWRKVRARVLRREPMCRACNKAPATDVDHIVPIRQGGARYSTENLQPLCRRCHNRKTRSQ